MKAVVTGGAGFVGSNLIKKLNEKGVSDIIIIDNYEEAKLKNISDLTFSNYLDYTDGIDIVKKQLSATDGIDAFFHIGANADVLEGDAKKMMYLNYEFSKMYCEFCLENDIPFLYASSSAVYGNSGSSKIEPENENPHNIYAWSKWLFDKYAVARLAETKNRIVGFRLFNVFGMREFHKGKNACIANRFTNFIPEKGFIDLFKDPIERDYVWVEDLADIFYQTFNDTSIESGIYNVGGGEPIAHKAIAKMVVKNYIDQGIKQGNVQDFVKEIDMPGDLKEKFQFYTCAQDVLPFISDLTKGNMVKLNSYIKELIALSQE